MLDIKYLVENKDKVKEALSHRNGNFEKYIDNAVENELKRKQIIAQVETLKATRNTESDNIAKLKKEKKDASQLIASMQKIGTEIKALDSQLAEAENNIRNALLAIPNIPHESCPIGLSDEDNIVIRHWGEPTKFDFEPLPHWTIGENMKIFDWTRSAKISGARFTVYRGLGAKLERALIAFMLDTHIAKGYEEIMPPYIVNRASMTATGQLPKFEEDAFSIKNSDYFLISTAEIPVTNLHRDEILSASDLPIKYCSYTACFRAEAGSAGRDTRGLIRQHQFNKVELVKFVNPENSYEELEKLTADAEDILKLLKLPYRVSMLSTGDIGFSSAKTYDLEVWLPSYNKYMEISSCSNFESYQARRGNIRFRDLDGKPKYLHTLNGSGLAIGRTVAAIIENYQNADGSVTVPDVLIPYMNCNIIK